MTGPGARSQQTLPSRRLRCHLAAQHARRNGQGAHRAVTAPQIRAPALCRDLDQYIDVVGVFVDHALEATHLAFDPAKAFEHRVLVVRMPGATTSAGVSQLRGLDRTREFDYLKVKGTKVVACWTVGPQYLQTLWHRPRRCLLRDVQIEREHRFADVAAGAWHRRRGQHQHRLPAPSRRRRGRQHHGRADPSGPQAMESTNSPGKTLAARQVRIQNLDVTLPPEPMERNDYVAGM